VVVWNEEKKGLQRKNAGKSGAETIGPDEMGLGGEKTDFAHLLSKCGDIQDEVVPEGKLGGKHQSSEGRRGFVAG